MWSVCTIILLMTSIEPSVWLQKEVDLVSLVSNNIQRLDHNVLMNLLSRFDIMVYGIPKCTHTHSKKSFTVSSTVILFLQADNIAILENLSMTTNTQSLPCLVEGRPDRQSIEVDSQGWMGVGRGLYKPLFLIFGLAMAQLVQDLIYFSTSYRIFG